MDLIRAYACGLLPDSPIEASEQERLIKAEAQDNISGLTDFKFRVLMDFSTNILVYIDDDRLGDVENIVSTHKLCKKLLELYEQQQEQV